MGMIDQIYGAPRAADAPLPEDPPSQAGIGLRGGWQGAKAAVNATLSSGAAAVGAPGFAARRKADAQADAAESAQTLSSLRVPTWDKVHGLSDAGDYAAGKLGEMAPAAGAAIGAGAAGTLLGGPATGLRAATAALAPVEAGDIVQRQWEDPASQLRSPQENFARAAVGGVATSALENYLPGSIGSRLLGAGAKEAAARTLSQSVLHNAAEGVAGQGAAGAGAEAIRQQAASPDKPFDTGAIADAGLGGAVMGVPLAGLGVAADTIHGIPRRLGGAISDAAGSVADKAKAAATGVADVVKDGAPQPASDWTSSIAARTQGAYDSMGSKISENVANARGWYNDLMTATDVPEEIKARLKDTAQNFASKANASSLKAAWDTMTDFRKSAADKTPTVVDPVDGVRSALNPDTTADDVIAHGSVNTPEQNAAFAEAADPATMQQLHQETEARTAGWMQRTATSLAARADLSPEVRQTISDALANPGDTAKAAAVATAQIAVQAKDTAVGAARGALAALGKLKDSGASGTKQSADLSGVRAVIEKELIPHLSPELVQDPKARATVVEATRRFIDTAARGNFLEVEHAAQSMRSMLGADTEGVLSKVYTAIEGSDPQGLDRFHAVLGEMHQAAKREQGLQQMIGKLLPDESRADVSALTNHLLNWARGDKANALGQGQASRQFFHARVHAELAKTFGEGSAGKILKALEDHTTAEQAVPGEQRRAPAESDAVAKPTDAATEAGAEFGTLSERANDRELYGAGKDRTGTKGTMKPLQSPQAARAAHPEFQSAAEKLIADLQLKHPDKLVRFVSEREHNREQGLDGGSNDHGFVSVEGLKDRDQLSDRDVEKMRLDTDKFSKSPSRLEIATEGDKGRPVLVDAVKLTQHFLNGMESGDGLSDVARAGRAFMEGVSALQARHGRFEIPDSTVIDKKGTTFGEAKAARVEQAEDRMSKAGKEKLALLRKAYRTAAEADRPDILQEVQDLLTHEKARELTSGDAAGFGQADFASGMYDKNGVATKETAIDAVGTGRTEANNDQNIHQAAAEFGPDLKRTANLDGSPQHVSSANTLNTKPAMLAIRKLGADGTAIGRKIAGRAQRLLDNVSAMKQADQQRLLEIAGKNAADAAPIVNELARKYKDVMSAPAPFDVSATPKLAADSGRPLEEPPSPKALAAKKAALLEAASSSDPKLLEELSTSTDAKGLQRAAEVLAKDAPHAPALEAANARLDHLVQDPDTAYGMLTKKYSLEQTDPGLSHTSTARAEVQSYLDKVLGKSVNAKLAEHLGHAGEYIHAEKLIRVSAHALNPLSAAFHESLHAFMAQLHDAGLHEVARTLEQAAGSPHAIRQLEAHFKDQPEVMAQLRNDPEERAAYMYQLHQQGMFEIGPKTKTVFNKISDFIRSALGIWSNDERAQHILKYFSEGEYAKSIGKPGAIHDAVMTQGRNKIWEGLKAASEPFRQMGDTVLAAGQARVRDTGISALHTIADAIKPEHTDSGKDTGWLAASRNARASTMNALATTLRGVKQAHLDEALEQLQSGVAARSPEARLAAGTIKKMLRGMHDYMAKAGVDVGDLGKDYFPRVWDADAISRDQAGFAAMLTRNGVADPEVVLRNITSNDGNHFAVDTRTPGFQSGKERKLAAISGADAAPFQEKNLYRTLNSYVAQATRRAEWARRFGADGERLNGLLDEAKAHGATQAQLETTEKYLKGVTGTLGDGINPTARRMIGNMLVYQNLRLLPLGIFSSAVDPLGVLVRGGTVGDAFNAFKRGIAEMPKNFKRYDPTATKDWQTQAAELTGVIDNAALTHSLGALYSQGMVGDLGRRLNDGFFRFNLMEQYNNSMRVSGTEAAMKFIVRHGLDTPGAHSARYLSELGLTRDDVKLDQHGRLALTEADGLKADQVNKVHDAVNKWVDGAVLRPDAADKPIWMNDPHFALFAHLKQFVYSFQHTVIDRMIHEAKEGNYTPAIALAAYVPTMIAADYLKGFIQGGGEQPDFRKNWGAGEWIMDGVTRAGLQGTGQFSSDFVKNVREGDAAHAIGGLAGPTTEQLIDAIKTAGGNERFGTFALHSMPANALYGWAAKGGQQADPTFSD